MRRELFFIQFAKGLSRFFHERETFICAAFKGEAVIYYREPLITKQMGVSISPRRGENYWKKILMDWYKVLRPLSIKKEIELFEMMSCFALYSVVFMKCLARFFPRSSSTLSSAHHNTVGRAIESSWPGVCSCGLSRYPSHWLRSRPVRRWSA